MGEGLSRVVVALVGPSEDGMRLDAFLSKMDECPSRSACVRLISSERVSINGTLATEKSERVLLGDRVSVELQQEEHVPGRLLPNVEIPIDIRYEDEFLIVLSKQAGLVCHPSPGHVDDTLANALVAHCGYDNLGKLQGEDRPGIVHRLDMDTSGLMLAAKDDDTQRALQDLIRLRVLDRRYVVLVQGYVSLDEGGVTTGIMRSPKDRLHMIATDDPNAREAITTYRVLERFEAGARDEGYTLMECHLYTGRTHQIRVHMRHIGHPVVGDQLYGISSKRARRGDRDLGLRRQFLHSWHVAFDHPATGEHLVLADALPEDLSRVMRGLAGRSMGRTETGENICSQLIP